MDAIDLHDRTLARLQTLQTVRVYDGEVPETVPSDARGRAHPYAFVWPSAGNRPAEQALESRDGLTWPVRVTVASGSHRWTMAATRMVRDLLDGWDVTPFATLVEEVEDLEAVTVLSDASVDPARWYVPLVFRTTI